MLCRTFYLTHRAMQSSEECDPSSSNFNPLVALYSEDNVAQNPDIKVYDNIAVFEVNMKRQQKAQTSSGASRGTSQRKLKSFSQRRRMEEEAKNRDLAKLKELMELRKHMDAKEKSGEDIAPVQSPECSQRRRRAPKNLLISMEKLSKGPLSQLYQIVGEHLKCHVYTRDFCGLRGVCAGYIVAYDRYMNLAMVDIDETFRKAPIGKVAEHQKPLSVSSLKNAVERSHSEQIIVSKVQYPKHAATTGVQIKRRIKQSCSITNRNTAGKNVSVKNVGVNPINHEIFHGGLPQLYHRHVNQMLVRGDSVVLIAIK